MHGCGSNPTDDGSATNNGKNDLRTMVYLDDLRSYGDMLAENNAKLGTSVLG